MKFEEEITVQCQNCEYSYSFSIKNPVPLGEIADVCSFCGGLMLRIE